ncbi:hypothetical protein ACFOZY_00900 [Chungangia koreensis]|uniref:Uncharacterized protein n=1 Tax=Chungangia koreensis TaxID=752657 RepID=A0ABV8X1L0_9LACT
MLNRIRNKFTTVQAEEVEINNIYEILPPPETIMGEATEEEMNKAAELEIRHMAYMRLQDMKIQLDGVAYKELLRDFQTFETDSNEFWRGIARRLSVPYEWPIRIDHANGPIYMGEHEISVEEVEEEEES